ncbi:sulfotransferase domain-containing protein [Actinoplanes sp. NPDC051343]|uniref:sulfotransferase domain-containing protein n=1 Tax=Actinoplanes sp. NPDC051343 TaxID=3363906 RepID=UPI0037B2F2B1
MSPPPVRYRSPEEDSARWLSFPFRPGDIVISTRRRTGTTWLQMICALLIFQRPELPAPLWHLSPWLDHLVTPPGRLYAQLAAQPHRRFIKTHTPLDGLPYYPYVTYVVSARHPLDMFVSLRHRAEPEPLSDDLTRWLDEDSAPPEPLPAVMWHLTDAWTRRFWPNVLLVHYDDLVVGLEAQMRYLAWRLGIPVPEALWPGLVEAAGFDRMRDRAAHLVQDTPAALFRRGRPGAREVFTAEERARYQARVAGLAPPDLLEWLHAPRLPK